jgi:hypothetical protein
MYWGNSTRFHHKLIHEGPVIANNVTLIPYYTAYEISTAEHGGTHMDAPIHFAKGIIIIITLYLTRIYR